MSSVSINGVVASASTVIVPAANGHVGSTAAPVISYGEVGPQGTTGAKGDTGAGGVGGGSLFTQAAPASTWIIVHNLGRPVIAQVYISGQGVLTDLIDSDANTLTIVFSSPQAGQVVYS